VLGATVLHMLRLVQDRVITAHEQQLAVWLRPATVLHTLRLVQDGVSSSSSSSAGASRCAAHTPWFEGWSEQQQQQQQQQQGVLECPPWRNEQQQLSGVLPRPCAGCSCNAGTLHVVACNLVVVWGWGWRQGVVVVVDRHHLRVVLLISPSVTFPWGYSARGASHNASCAVRSTMGR
jgi:hypothetical protein